MPGDQNKAKLLSDKGHFGPAAFGQVAQQFRVPFPRGAGTSERFLLNRAGDQKIGLLILQQAHRFIQIPQTRKPILPTDRPETKRPLQKSNLDENNLLWKSAPDPAADRLNGDTISDDKKVPKLSDRAFRQRLENYLRTDAARIPEREKDPRFNRSQGTPLS